MTEHLLTAAELANRLGLHVGSVWRLVRAGNLPAPFYVAPRAARWDASEVRTWLASRRMRPAEAAARRRAERIARERKVAAAE